MGEIADMTAAPVIWKNKGKEYTVSPLVPADLGRIERELGKVPIERAAAKLAAWGESLSDDERYEIIRKADAESVLAGDIKTDEGKKGMFSLAGGVLMLWLSLVKCHKDITLGEVQEMVTFENLEEVQKMIDKVSGMTPKKGDEVDLGKSEGETTQTRSE